MPIYETDPTKKERRIAFRQFQLGPIPMPIPLMEERRRIVRQVSSGQTVDVSNKVGFLGEDVGIYAATVFGDRWANVAPVDDDMGVILTEMGRVLTGGQINRYPAINGRLWYKSDKIVKPGVYERLKTETRHLISLKGWRSEKRHRLGRMFQVGEQRTLRHEEDDGYYRDGLVAVVLEGTKVQLASCHDGRYESDGPVFSGRAINEEPLTRENFYAVLPKAS